MAETTNSSEAATAVTVRRHISAPPERVFDAWTEAEGMGAWMCPAPTERAEVEADVRVGGRFKIDMHGAGEVYEHTGEYLEVVPPRRLVFTWVSRATGGRESRVTVELFAMGGGTDIVLTHEGLPSAESARNHDAGWTDILRKLAERLD